jgi:hypothetical protein
MTATTWIKAKLKDGSWEDAACGAAYHYQFERLCTRPWHCVPIYADLPHTLAQDDFDGSNKFALDLLRRLLAAGLSRFKPDVLGALERAEATAAKAAHALAGQEKAPAGACEG